MSFLKYSVVKTQPSQSPAGLVDSVMLFSNFFFFCCRTLPFMQINWNLLLSSSFSPVTFSHAITYFGNVLSHTQPYFHGLKCFHILLHLTLFLWEKCFQILPFAQFGIRCTTRHSFWSSTVLRHPLQVNFQLK